MAMATPMAPHAPHAPHASSSASIGGSVGFKLQTKSAVALVNERRIEFLRARNARASMVATIDPATGKILLKTTTKKSLNKKDTTMIVQPAVVERVLAWKHSKKIGPGLANLGNTCYLNSVLQCLCYTPSFVQYVLQKDVLAKFGVSSTATQGQGQGFKKQQLFQHQQQPSGFCGVRAMAKLLQNVHGANGTSGATARVLQPKEIVINIRHVSKNFRIGRQEDSHEFFRLLLDTMQRSCLRKAHIKQEATDPRARTSFIHRIFGGTLKNTLKCAKCLFISSRNDDFLDLSLEINNGISSIKNAIKHFTSTEVLDVENAWKCSNCQQKSRAEKGLTIEKCPNVLVIQLKRFDGIFGGKIKKHIEFETTLNLALGMQKASEDRKRNRCLYELHAVLVHAGFSTNCGHYYAFVKGSSGQWYEMNDETVRWVSVDTVLQQKAYMLFYSRVLPVDERPKEEETAPVKKQKAKSEEDESLGVPVKAAAAAVVDKALKKKEDEAALSMNGFLNSLRTQLPEQQPEQQQQEDHAEDVVKGKSKSQNKPPPQTLVTYKVRSVPGTRKRTRRVVVPVFGGAMGRLRRFQKASWKALPPRALTMETTVETTLAPAVAPQPVPVAAALQKPKTPLQTLPPVEPIVEKIAFNPRELRDFGDKNAALYGKSVSQWGANENEHTTMENAQEDTVESGLLKKHAHVLSKMKEEDWKFRKAQRKSSWDEELDLGKQKKLKKRKEFVSNEGNANAFQMALLQKKMRQY